MSQLELWCLAIVALYIGVRLWRAGAGTVGSAGRREVLLRLGTLLVASWIGENTMIRAWSFYSYADPPTWTVFLDRVPIFIVVIWPVVIDSAWVLGVKLAGVGASSRRVALATAAFVLVDASLIEPIAVRAGLWRWSEPGIFTVPLIGILGWSVFTFFAVHTLARPGSVAALRAITAIGFAPVATHLTLVALWWTFFRWVTTPIDDWTAAVGAWVLLAPTTRTLWRHAPPVDRLDLWVRIPATAFFAVLIAPEVRSLLPLLVYALAFVPPYLSLFRARRSRRR